MPFLVVWYIRFMKSSYDPYQVEEKWRARWAELGTNEPDLDRASRPFYNLMMFPYPSAEGLHVGNVFAFTGADVFGRFQRMRGWNVFQPMGFDAFGIHSENFALKMGMHPAELIPRNIANFTRQLTAIGGMFAWKHVLATTDPDLLPVDAMDLPPAAQARPRLQEKGGGQLVPQRQDRTRERAGHCRCVRAVWRNGGTARARTVVLPDYRLR